MNIKGKINVLLTDCDGVLTDGGMYYFDNGLEAKKFNTRDGMAIKQLREKGIKVGIITGENTNIVKNRAKKLKLDYLFLGVDNKREVLEIICEKEKIDYQNVAYVGDDLNDLEILRKVGFSICPNDACREVKEICTYISSKDGGQGVIRDAVDNLIREAI